MRLVLRRAVRVLLDGPWVIQLALFLLSAGWAVLLSMPYCLTCQATFEGLHAHGSEHAWTLRLAAAAVVALVGVVTRRGRPRPAGADHRPH